MNDNVFSGLKALLETAFPKRCSNCGRVYHSVAHFLAETQDLPDGRSSLKASMEEDGSEIVEVFRNCKCGSTLMDEFGCRRDLSERGKKRRDEFDKLKTFLQRHGMSEATARQDIFEFLAGRSNRLAELLRAQKANRKRDGS
ncbi:MAG: oxidoreductase [Gammaproteobacteria bacterium]